MRTNVLLLFCLLPSIATAQLSIDPARGLVGQEARITVHLPGQSVGETSTFTGQLKLGNSTVFYPERFLPPSGDSVIGFSLRAITDSLYDFSFTIKTGPGPRTAGDTLVFLAGEALAGSDSVSTIALLNVLRNGTPTGSASSRIVTSSIGPPLPYIRFATLEQNYPNPIRKGQSTTFGFRIDKPSEVRFVIYTDLGQELEVIQLGLIGIGPHTFVYTPGLTQPSGVYWARMITNTGSAEKPFHIVR